MQVSLIVIRCQDIYISKIFYENLGLVFQKEKHGKGPEHFSSEYDHIVFELYPNKGIATNDNIRLGFKSKNLSETIKSLDITSSYEFDGNTVYIVTDPDGRKIELS